MTVKSAALIYANPRLTDTTCIRLICVNFLCHMKIPRLPVVTVHIIGWIFFQSLPIAFLLSQSGRSLGGILGSFGYWQFCIFYIVVFYANEYLLLPRLFNRRLKWLYAIAVAALLVAAFFIQPFEKMSGHSKHERFEQRNTPPPGEAFRMPPPNGMEHRPMRRGHMQIDIISIFLLLLTILFSMAIDITRRWRLTEQRAIRAETDKVNAELRFLKAQINPHFLFNTLNNIYTLSLTRNEHTPEMILKLSNIMRYVTDEVKQDFVALESELQCISDYIDLQKLRMSKKNELHFSVTGDAGNHGIAPLILMTFVENLFKYGLSNHDQTRLVIAITITENRIHLLTENPVPQAARQERDGIGINNTKERLQHLYAGRHELLISENNGIFKVELSLFNR